MSSEQQDTNPTYARDLPISKWLRLALLGSVKEPESGDVLVIARKFGKMLNVMNALAPILVAVLLFSGALTPSYLSIAFLIVLWVIANVAILRGAPLEKK